MRGSRVVNLLSGRGLQKQANRFRKSFTHFSMTVLIHAWLCLVHLSIIWIFLSWCSFLHSFWNSRINNVIDSVVWQILFFEFCRDYTNPYLPVNPTAIDGPVQVSHDRLPSVLHYWIFTNELFSPVYCRCWWEKERAWEQCTSCINWEHAVCCHRGCSSHGEELLIA